MWKVLILCLASRGLAFTTTQSSPTLLPLSTAVKQGHPAFLRYSATCPRGHTLLFAEEGQQSTETASDLAEPASSSPMVSREPTGVMPKATPVATTPSGASDDSKKYPIDVPSPILLASSMFLAISGTGSLFELLGGNPTYGFAPTAAIALLSLPLCLFLFYASVLKAQAETEEDDRQFMSGRK